MPWISCEDRFIESDVLRWVESVFEERRKKLVRVAKLRVTAQFDRVDGDYIVLTVGVVEVLEDRSGGRKALKFKVGDEIRRKRSTVEKGRPERRLWSDETARLKVVRTAKKTFRRRSRARKAFKSASDTIPGRPG